MPNELIRQQNIQSVLHQAMKLFAENGVENTSFELIARECGLSLRSVQNYYHTKNDLIAAVLDYELTLEMKEMKTCIASEQYQHKNGAEQILTIAKSVYYKAVQNADMVSCATQMQHILSRASQNEGTPLLTGNWQYIMEQIRDAFTRGLQDGSITNQMESSLMDARSITLALYGIKEQIAFAMCDKELRKLFQPEKAAQKYVQQMELLLSAK